MPTPVTTGVFIESVTDLQNAGGVDVVVSWNLPINQIVQVKYYHHTLAAWTLLGVHAIGLTAIGSTTISGTTNALGVLWWAANSHNGVSAANLSNVLPQAITRDSQAVYDKCLQGVQDTLDLAIGSGAIDWMKGTCRQRKPRFDSMSCDLPGLLITPVNPSMEPVTNVRDQITYPCSVFIVDTESNQADDDETATIPYHLTAERIRRLFSQQRLSGVDEVDVCRVQLGNHLEWQANIYEGVQSLVIVNCLTREYRGI